MERSNIDFKTDNNKQIITELKSPISDAVKAMLDSGGESGSRRPSAFSTPKQSYSEQLMNLDENPCAEETEDTEDNSLSPIDTSLVKELQKLLQ